MTDQEIVAMHPEFAARHSTDGPPVRVDEDEWMIHSIDARERAEGRRRFEREAGGDGPRRRPWFVLLFPDAAGLTTRDPNRTPPVQSHIGDDGYPRPHVVAIEHEPPTDPRELLNAMRIYRVVRVQYLRYAFNAEKERIERSAEINGNVAYVSGQPFSDGTGEPATVEDVKALRTLADLVALNQVVLADLDRRVADLPEERAARERQAAIDEMNRRAEAARARRAREVVEELKTITLPPSPVFLTPNHIREIARRRRR